MLVYGVLVAGAGAVATGPVIRQVLSAVRGSGAPDEGVDDAEAPVGAAGLRTWGTERPLAFPLMVAYDPIGPVLWVTTRDWPALGRLELTTERWRWTELG